MKNAEDSTFDNEATDLQLDESLVISNPEQEPNQELNLDDLYSMLNESSTAENRQIDPEVPSGATSGGASVLEELQAMYSDLDSSNDESTSVSVMEELEAMYAHSDKSAINNAEYSSVSDDEPERENVSALDELEALLTGSQTLDDAVDDESETFDSSNYDHLFENRTLVLDEIQNLLQSSIEELKEKDDSNISSSMRALEAEYPTRNELINLLETKLGQLRMISDSSDAHDFGEGSSVLDELNALLSETGSDENELGSYLSTTDDSLDDQDESVSDDIDKYISSIASQYESSSEDETVATNSVLDDLESLLTDSTYTTGSEELQTDSTLSELDTYLDELSEAMDVDVTNSEQDVELNFEPEESGSSLDTLKQLEEMLAETAMPENDENTDDIEVVESDVAIKHELSDMSGKDKKDTVDEINKFRGKEPPAEVHKQRLMQKSQNRETFSPNETDNKSLSPRDVLSVAVVVVIAIVFWNLFGQEDEQLELVENVVSTEPVFMPEAEPSPEENVVHDSQDEPENIDESSVLSEIPDDAQPYEDTIYQLETEDFSITIERPIDDQSSIQQDIVEDADDSVALHVNDTETPNEVPASDIQSLYKEFTHIIVKNDTLWSIAKRYLGDPYLYSELARLSLIENPNRIYPGDIVHITQKIKTPE